MKKEIKNLIFTWCIMLSFKVVDDGAFKIKYCKFLKDNLREL